MAESDDSKTQIVSEIGSAYRATPILTGMLLLIIIMFGGIGWYEVRSEDRIYAYIKSRDEILVDSFQQMVGLALGCRLPDAQQKIGSPKTIVPAQPLLPDPMPRISP